MKITEKAATESKFTPGPWKAVLVPSTLKSNNHFEITADSPHMDGLKQAVCTINGPHKHENYRANAVLIASTPDLLRQRDEARAIIKQLVSDHDDGLSFEVIWSQARAILARVEKGSGI